MNLPDCERMDVPMLAWRSVSLWGWAPANAWSVLMDRVSQSGSGHTWTVSLMSGHTWTVRQSVWGQVKSGQSVWGQDIPGQSVWAQYTSRQSGSIFFHPACYTMLYLRSDHKCELNDGLVTSSYSPCHISLVTMSAQSLLSHIQPWISNTNSHPTVTLLIARLLSALLYLYMEQKHLCK